MEQPVQSSPECCVHHQIALYKALYLSSQHVQMLCHSQWHFLLTKTTLYDDSLKKAFDDKQMAAVRLLGENQIKKKDV